MRGWARGPRGAAAGAILCVATLLAPAWAHADSARPTALKTAWFWSLVGASVQGHPLPADAPAQASLVPDGSLGVAYLAAQEDAVLGTSGADRVAAVALDLGAAPAGATFSSLVLSVPLDATAQQVQAQTPLLSACELLGSFDDASAPAAGSKAPADSPGSCVPGTFAAGVGPAGGYRFDLTAMANDWSGGAPNEGVLIRPTDGLATPQPPFSLVLAGKRGITAVADYAPPPTPAPVDVPLPPAPVVPRLAPPPPLPQPQPVAPAPAPVALAPAVPAPQVNPRPTSPALARVAYSPGALVPDGRWWLGLVAVALLVGAVRLVLGDPLAPVAVDRRRRRFATVVRRPLAAP